VRNKSVNILRTFIFQNLGNFNERVATDRKIINDNSCFIKNITYYTKYFRFFIMPLTPFIADDQRCSEFV